jgi:hypothetical protein
MEGASRVDRSRYQQIEARHRGIGRIRTVTGCVAAGAAALAVTFGVVFAHSQQSSASVTTPQPTGSTGTRTGDAPKVDDQQPDGGGLQPPARPPGRTDSRRHHTSSGGS